MSKHLPTIEQARQMTDDTQLIEFILERFHERHRHQLKELIELATEVESVHSDEEACPSGLAQHLISMNRELEQHMFKEENILFPLIMAGRGAMATGPIGVMKHEHEEHCAAIEALEIKANNLNLPIRASDVWQTLYSRLEEFIRDLHAHIALENDVLFARQ